MRERAIYACASEREEWRACLQALMPHAGATAGAGAFAHQYQDGDGDGDGTGAAVAGRRQKFATPPSRANGGIL